MKKLITLFLLLFLFTTVFADKRSVDLNYNQKLQINANNSQKLSLETSFSEIQFLDVNTKEGEFTELFLPGAYATGKLGTPKLPAIKKLIEIPFGAKVEVNVVDYEVTQYDLTTLGISNKILPNQPSPPKNLDPEDIKFEYKAEIYQQNRYISYELAQTKILGVLRGKRLARLELAPISYNPVENKIKVYNNLQIEINFIGSDQAFTSAKYRSTYSPYFEPVYDKIINNRVDHNYPDHPDLTKYPVKYLIVSDRMFESTLQPFIEWKTKKGFEVIVAYTDVIGSSVSDIQTWIHDQYNAGTTEDPAPTFGLLVGDVTQVRASDTGSSSGEVTDLYYFSVDGDMFPEMYYGRFSATSVSELQPIINKTLYYEQYQFSDPSYLDNVTLIAGADATWNPRVGQATIQYGTQNYFNSAHGFNQVNDYLTSYSGCYDTIDDGIGFINYTAHGSTTSWADPGFSVSDVNNLTNENQPVLAIGNCCVTGQFDVGECFGESWTRADNGGIGYIGSAPNTYWFEDFYWSVGAFPLSGNNDGYVPSYEETTWGAYDAPYHSDYVTQDALKFIGNLAVTEVDIQGYPQHSSPLYYWQAYHLFGDPSLVSYLTQGSTNTVSYNSVLPIGSSEFIVNADNDSYVAISMNGNLHGAALVESGNTVDVPITPFTTAGTADIVVTKPQYQPYISTVTVNTLSGPYVSITDYTIQAGDDDVIEFGETVNLTVTLENVGSDPTTNVNMVLSESDTYINLTDSSESFGNIAAGAQITQTNAFSFTVSDNIPDNYNFSLQSEISCTEDTWNSDMNLTGYAPILTIESTNVNDGDNNMLDPGETAGLEITLVNEGGADAANVNAILSSADANITINNNSDNLSSLAAGTSAAVNYNVSAAADTDIGHVANFLLDIDADNNYVVSDNFSLTIGLIIEDFESGDFSTYDWTFGGDANWQISSSSPQEGTYCAQSMDIDDNQTSELIINADVMSSSTISFYKKVSSESNYDYLRFYIDGSEQGSWSGEVAWSEESYNVSAGNHEFKWVFDKDYSVSNGSDCAWIDYIIFPPMGTPQPELSLSPVSIDFGDVIVNESSEATFTITNNGGGTLSGDITTPTGYSVSANAKKLKHSLTKDILSYNISASSSQDYTLTFSPITTADYSGNVVITSNDTANPSNNLAVTGTGVAPPEIDVNPTAFNETLGIDGTTENDLTIANLGDSDLTYTADISYTTKTRDVVLTEDFESGTEWPSGWSETTNSSVGWFNTTDGSSSYWTVPAGNGSYACANDDATDDDGSVDYLITPQLDLSSYSEATITFQSYFTAAYSQTAHLEIDTGSGWTEIQSISENTSWTEITIDLTAYCGSGFSNVKISFHADDNGGWASGWAIDDIEITATGGSQESWLSLNGNPSVSGTVVSGSSDIIIVGFDAAGLAESTYAADINLTSNDSDESNLTLPVSLTVSSGGTPGIRIDEDALAFGDIQIGNSSTKQFIIYNTGTATLTGTIMTPNDFTINEAKQLLTKRFKSEKDKENLNFSITQGNSQTFDLIFAPSSEQSYYDSVVITNNAGDDETITVSGNGLPAPEADIDWSPSSLSITMNPDQNNSRNLQITNNGDGDLTYSANINYNPVVLKKNKAYNPSTYSNTTDDYITNVTFNTINNSSGQEGSESYGDYTAISTDVVKEETYTLTVTFWSEGMWTEHVKAWIDWNQDEIFDDSTEGYDLGDGIDATLSIDITVPADAESGSTRLRVIEQYNSDPEPCDPHSTTYGETEDYTINVQNNVTENWLTINDSSAVSGTIMPSAYENLTIGFDTTDLTDSSYTANIVITSNDPDTPSATVSVNLIVSTQQNQPDWQAVVYPNNSATLYGYVTINDINASQDDIVGAFVNGECRACGTVQLDAGTAYSTLLINVATDNDTVNFRVYDDSEDVIYETGNTVIVSPGETIGSQSNLFHIDANDNYGQTVENDIETDNPVAYNFDGGIGDPAGNGNSVNVDPPDDSNPEGGELIITRLNNAPASIPNPDNILELWYDIDASNYTGGYPVTVTFEWDTPVPVNNTEPILIFSTDNGNSWLFAGNSESGVTINEWDLINTDGDNYSVTFTTEHFSQWIMGNGADTPIALGNPQNITLTSDAGQIELTWDSVQGATSYKVYSSDNPYTDFTEDTSGTFNGTSWSTTDTEAAEKFFYIKAIK